MNQRLSVSILKPSNSFFVRNLATVEDIFRRHWGASNIRLREQSSVLHLRDDLSLIGIQDIAIGQLDSVSRDDELVIACALLVQSKYIIPIHNHPSDNDYPSQDDIECAIRLHRRADFFDITVLEEVIIGLNTVGRFSALDDNSN